MAREAAEFYQQQHRAIGSVRSNPNESLNKGGAPLKVTAQQMRGIKRRIRHGESQIAESVYVEGGAALETLRTHVRNERKNFVNQQKRLQRKS